MAAADASAPSIASVPLAVSAAADLPIHAGEEWRGHYRCAQGRTDMRLVVDSIARRDGDDGYDVEGTFSFLYESPENGSNAPLSAQGVYRVDGIYRPKQHALRLSGTEWIHQPPSYVFVTFDGSISQAGVYSGRVEGPGCTSFSASRVTLPSR
jgi:hypothetical protein